MPSLTIDRLCDLYEAWAREHLRKPSTNQPTRTWKNIRSACAHLRSAPPPPDLRRRSTIGRIPAEQMTARLLYHLQEHLARSGNFRRRSVNDAVGWCKTMFRWAAHPTRQLVSEDVAARVSLVGALRAGRTPAPESPPVHSVPIEHVQATCLYASEKLATMIWTHWHTGMRPEELVIMTRSTIDRSGPVWTYTPRWHKTEHFGKTRTILIGPQAQRALTPWLAKTQTDCLFEGVCRGLPTGQSMRRTSYGRTIQRINRTHGLAPWTPNQIRHAFATRVAREAGKKAAQLLLGHASENMTGTYIDPDAQAATDLAARFG